MLSPAPIIEGQEGEVSLDVKFVEGMKLHSQLWPGRIVCVMWRGSTFIAEPMRYSISRLGFDLLILDDHESVPEMLLDEATLVYAAADDIQHLDLSAQMIGRFGRVVYTVEQSLRGRLAGALASTNSLRRRLGSFVWNVRQDRHLRKALREADGIHCNGFPSFNDYRKLNGRSLRYLDNRIRTPQIMRSHEFEAKSARLRSGEPLRLVWFGHFEETPGTLDLLPVAYLLSLRGIPFTLQIIGAGVHEGQLRAGIESLGLGHCVAISEQGSFDSELVPYLKANADIFVSAHRLHNPLSSYIESLGCGMPIIGYRNAMTRALVRESGAGSLTWRNQPSSLVSQITRMHHDREAVIEASRKAIEFARQNSFENVFVRRMTDLREIVGME
ncbi:MAG: glycosyltransferase [Paracoccaceae bacterium]